MVTIESTAALTANLLLIVVLKLCDIARAIDLEDIDSKWGFPPLNSDNRLFSSESLSLGPFAFIHSLNFVILFLTFSTLFRRFPGSWSSVLFPNENLVIVPNAENLLYLVSLIFVWSVWFLLPIFEVQDYASASKESEEIPDSLLKHFLWVSIITLALIINSSAWRFLAPIIRPYNSALDYAIAVLLSLPISLISLLIFAFVLASADGFLTQLNEEFN